MADLKSSPRVHRLQTSKSLTSLGAINLIGGYYGAGIIPAVSMCSRGEALGHYAWIDGTMLQQIVDGCNANEKLLKCRFTRPDLCGDECNQPAGWH